MVAILTNLVKIIIHRKCNKHKVEKLKKTHREHLNLLKLVFKSKILKLSRKKDIFTHRNKD